MINPSYEQLITFIKLISENPHTQQSTQNNNHSFYDNSVMYVFYVTLKSSTLF